MPALHVFKMFEQLDRIDPTATDDESPAPLTGFDAEVVTPSQHAHGHEKSNEPPDEIPLSQKIKWNMNETVWCGVCGYPLTLEQGVYQCDRCKDEEIPIGDAIETLHREAKKIEAIG